MNNADKLSSQGTLTPDHVIRTKPFAWVIKNDIEKSAENFKKKYHNTLISMRKKV